MPDLQQAISAIKSGDKATGKQLLIELIKSNPNNETAWLWMTQVVNTDQERLKCLQNVLKINPGNEQAKRGLAAIQQKQASQLAPKIEEVSKPVEAPSEPVLPVKQAELPTLEELVSFPPHQFKTIEQEATKKCPYCAEMIKAEAKICRFCGKDLEAGQQQTQQTLKTKVSSIPPKRKTSPLLVTFIVILVVCCGIPTALSVVSNSMRRAGFLPTVTPRTTRLALPTAATKPTVGISPDVEVYRAKVSEKGQIMGEALSDLGKLFQNPQLGDNDWSTSVALQIVIIRKTHEELTEMRVPPEMREIHTLIIDATSDCDEATDYLVDGLDNFSSSSINRAKELMISCGEKIKKPTTLIQEYDATH